MSQPNPIVSRLHGQKSRIARMLSPGVTSARPGPAGLSLSPIAPSFGGRKLRLAAQRMRALNWNLLGPARSATAMTIAHTIQAKFEHPKSILHIIPPSKTEQRVWSEVEQVFPAQAGQTEAPPEPGELRRGSVIQRFETVPQPGQSMESFRQQMQDTPAVRKPEVTPPPRKPLPAPGDRRVGRVQELPNLPKEKKGAEPARFDLPVEHVSTPAAAVQRKPEQSLPSGLERGMEPSSPFKAEAAKKPEISEGGQPGFAVARPLPEAHGSRPDLPAALPARKAAADGNPKIILQKAAPAERAPQPKTGLLPARPTPRPAPSNSVSQTVQRQIENRKPEPKAEIQPSILPQQARPISQTPSERPGTPPSEIRPDTNPALGQSIPEPLEGAPEAPARMSTQPEPVSAKARHKESPLEMPLTMEAMHPAVTGQVPPIATPKIPGVGPGPIQRKAVVSGEAKQLAKASPTEQSLLQRKPGQLSLRHPVATFKAARQAWRSAKTNVGKTVDSVTAPIRSAQSGITETGAKTVDATTTPISAQEMIMRAPVDKATDTVTAPIETARTKLKEMFGDEESSGPSTQADKQKPETPRGSPEQLAEQILPLVKRLLEIESERTGRRFRS
jgi:hypothetical protein